MKFMRAVWSPVPTILCAQSLGLKFIAPSRRTGYKPVHNVPCVVH